MKQKLPPGFALAASVRALLLLAICGLFGAAIAIGCAVVLKMPAPVVVFASVGILAGLPYVLFTTSARAKQRLAEIAHLPAAVDQPASLLPDRTVRLR